MPGQTYYLEMTEPKPADAAPIMNEDVQLVELVPPDPAVNRRFYLSVGGPWQWTDKADWSDDRWRAYVDGLGEAPEPAVEPQERIITSVLQVAGREAGYFELSVVGDQVEIRYFGLLPWAFGQGLGRPLLSAAIARGWRAGARRLWVHTCDKDHPAALPNYQKCGFSLYKTVDEQ